MLPVLPFACTTSDHIIGEIVVFEPHRPTLACRPARSTIVSLAAADVPAVSDIDPTDPVVVVCAAGMQAEGAGDIDGARELFGKVWRTVTSDYEGCIAAHHMARHQRDPADTLEWNQRGLTLADAVADESVYTFCPSAYLNIASTLEQLARWQVAEDAYVEVDEVLARLGDDGYGALVRQAVARGLARVADHRKPSRRVSAERLRSAPGSGVRARRWRGRSPSRSGPG